MNSLQILAGFDEGSWSKSSLVIISLILILFGIGCWAWVSKYFTEKGFGYLIGKRFSELDEYDEDNFFYSFIGWIPAVVVILTIFLWYIMFVLLFFYLLITRGVDWNTW
jgi:hypothetical protein